MLLGSAQDAIEWADFGDAAVYCSLAVNLHPYVERTEAVGKILDYLSSLPTLALVREKLQLGGDGTEAVRFVEDYLKLLAHIQQRDAELPKELLQWTTLSRTELFEQVLHFPPPAQ